MQRMIEAGADVNGVDKEHGETVLLASQIKRGKRDFNMKLVGYSLFTYSINIDTMLAIRTGTMIWEIALMS